MQNAQTSSGEEEKLQNEESILENLDNNSDSTEQSSVQNQETTITKVEAQELVECRFQLQRMFPQNYAGQFDYYNKTLMSASEMKDQSKGQEMIKKIRSLITKYKSKSVNLSMEIIRLKPQIEEVAEQFQALVSMKETIENNPLYAESELKRYETMMGDFVEIVKDLKKKLQHFDQEFCEGNDDLSLCKQDAYDLLPDSDSIVLFSDHDANLHKAVVSKEENLRRFQANIQKSFAQIVRAKENIEIYDKDNERLEKDIDDLEESKAPIREAITKLQESTEGDAMKIVEEMEASELKIKQASELLNQNLIKNQEKHDQSMQQMRSNIEQLSNQLASMDPMELVKSNNKTFSPSSVHICFVIDESGSMSGHFNELKSAFQSFVREASGGSPDNLISVIMFQDAARILHERSPITNYLSINPQGGGTNFQDAFLKLDQILHRSPNNRRPIVVFMTDGQDNSSYPQQVLTQWYQRTTEENKLVTFCIGFGPYVNHSQLQAICRSGNNGQLHRQIANQTVNTYIQCAGQHMEILNAFKAVGETISPLVQGLKLKMQLLRDFRSQAQQDFSQSQMAINESSNQQIEEMKKRFEAVKKTIEENKEQKSNVIDGEIQKLEDRLENINKLVQEKRNLIRENLAQVGGCQNEITLQLGKDFDLQEIQEKISDFLKIYMNGTDDEIKNIDDTHKEGLFFKIMKENLLKMRNILYNESRDEIIQKQREEKMIMYIQNGIDPDQIKKLMFAKQTIEELENIIVERSKYKIQVANYIKKITRILEKCFRQNTSSAGPDQMGLKITTKDVVIEILGNNYSPEMKDLDILQAYIKSMITRFEVTEPKIIKFFLNNIISFDDISPFEKEEEEKKAIRVFKERKLIVKLFPAIEKINQRISRCDAKKKQAEEKLDTLNEKGSLSEKEEKEVEKLEKQIEDLDNDIEKIQEEIEKCQEGQENLVPDGISFYEQLRKCIKDQLKQKKQDVLLDKFKNEIMRAVNQCVPDVLTFFDHIQQVERDSNNPVKAIANQ